MKDTSTTPENAAAGNQLSPVGSMGNGFEYEASLLVLNEKGTVAAKNDDACAKNPWNVAVPASLLQEACPVVRSVRTAIRGQAITTSARVEARKFNPFGLGAADEVASRVWAPVQVFSEKGVKSVSRS